MDSWIGILGVCFVQLSTSIALQFCPILLVDCLHWKSTISFLIQVRRMTIVLLQISSHGEKRVEHLIRILFLLSLDHHEMSLNIDMKIIRPVNVFGFTLNLNRNSWTLWLSCNVVNPGKIFHSNSIGSPSILSKFLYSGVLLNHVNLSSHAVFDSGFSFTFPKA